jgi:predicted kinase
MRPMARRSIPFRMLIILGGLPGSGKTTLARELARGLGAVHVRIDSIEAVLRGAVTEMNDTGYRVAYAVAEDNLGLGRTVIADSVNPLAVTRAAWVDVAKRSGVPAVEIEIVCSDQGEHRRRVEARTADINGLRLPTWSEVVERWYEPWDGVRAQIDTSGRTVAESIAELCGALSSIEDHAG